MHLLVSTIVVFLVARPSISASVSAFEDSHEINSTSEEVLRKSPLFGTCSKKKNCSSCVTEASWISKCRWCPVDRKCHEYGSEKNPCSKAQCIRSIDRCSSTLPTYDVRVAWQHLMLSAASYSEDPQKCLNNLPFRPPASTPPAAPRRPGEPAASVGLEGQTRLSSDDPEPTGGGFVVADKFSAHCDWIGSRCFAYTAVSHDLRLIGVAFRGTRGSTQLLVEILETITAPRIEVLGGKVQRYFKSAFDQLWPNAKKSVQGLVKQNPDYKVFVTGHSLGGALANLAASLLVADGVVSSSSLFQYTFGEPRVGNFDYAFQHDLRVNNSWRVVHYRDIVPHIPLCSDPICSGTLGGPYQHGIEVFYGAAGMTVSSPFTLCQGLPHNEDFGCSDGLLTREPCIDINDCIDYHRHYFGVPVSRWADTDCKSPSVSTNPSRQLEEEISSLNDVDDQIRSFDPPLHSIQTLLNSFHASSSDAGIALQSQPRPPSHSLPLWIWRASSVTVARSLGGVIFVLLVGFVVVICRRSSRRPVADDAEEFNKPLI